MVEVTSVAHTNSSKVVMRLEAYIPLAGYVAWYGVHAANAPALPLARFPRHAERLELCAFPIRSRALYSTTSFCDL